MAQSSRRQARLTRKYQKFRQNSDRISQLLQYAWLLDRDQVDKIDKADEKALFNLLEVDNEDGLLTRHSQEDVENPLKHLMRIMRKPENFFFTVYKLLDITLLPFQIAILQELWVRSFPMLIASRGAGKSFILALYIILRLLIHQGVKIVVVGAAFRQAKVIFEYCEMIWANAPILREICGGGKGRSNREQGPRRDIDRCEIIIGDSVAIFLPLGDGKKIRGQRANVIIADEFASVPPDIYETVVAGFGSTSQNPVFSVQEESRTWLLKKMGMWDEAEQPKDALEGNQSIIAGTAYYSFNWFAKYWNRWRGIIESRGDPEKLRSLQEGSNIEEDKLPNWKDYSIIRIPVDLLPTGFMDPRHIAKARLTVFPAIFAMEYGAVFSSDSDGFFNRALIESCVAGHANHEISHRFSAQLRGLTNAQHVMAIDPAAQSDNFAIVILALHGDHRRVVYCWTTRKKKHDKLLKAGLVKETNFWHFCARKIRQLLAAFPNTLRVAIDAQGGGFSVEEALHDTDKLGENELPIWQVIDPDPKKHKDTDSKKGLHILEMVQFSNARWVSEANHGLKKDLHDKALLFPYLDPALLGLSIEEDKQTNRLYDTLEDATMEIEALKDELATIKHDETANGRETWSVPRSSNQESKMRKDRYSALLMANMIARQIVRTEAVLTTETWGCWAGARPMQNANDAPWYSGTVPGEEAMAPPGRIVRRRGV